MPARCLSQMSFISATNSRWLPLLSWWTSSLCASSSAVRLVVFVEHRGDQLADFVRFPGIALEQLPDQRLGLHQPLGRDQRVGISLAVLDPAVVGGGKRLQHGDGRLHLPGGVQRLAVGERHVGIVRIHLVARADTREADRRRPLAANMPTYRNAIGRRLAVAQLGRQFAFVACNVSSLGSSAITRFSTASSSCFRPCASNPLQRRLVGVHGFATVGFLHQLAVLEGLLHRRPRPPAPASCKSRRP